MIHVVFQEADVNVLQQAIDLDSTLQGDIIQVKDDYAVGPLLDIYSQEGRENRSRWWKDVLSGGDYSGKVESGEVNDTKTVSDLTGRLDDNKEGIVWVWAAQNGHDVSGYYWLISQLKAYQGRIFILYLNNLPFINAKGNIFYPTTLHDIPAKEFLKAKKLARLITPSEFEIDPDEWTKICNEDKGVRLLEGGKKLIQKDHDLYDKELLGFITPDWQKVNKLIHSYLSKSIYKTGDAYLLWRLKQMISEGKIDAQGELKNMKDFEVKRKVEEIVNV